MYAEIGVEIESFDSKALYCRFRPLPFYLHVFEITIKIISAFLIERVTILTYLPNMSFLYI